MLVADAYIHPTVRPKLERLCQYLTLSAVDEKRVSLTPGGNVHIVILAEYGKQGANSPYPFSDINLI